MSSTPVRTHDEASLGALTDRAKRIRRNIVKMVAAANSGHPGGSLSGADLLTGLYFGGFLRYRPTEPDWPDRDRFILSKGHASPLAYAVLAEAGFVPEEELSTFRQLGSRFQGHVDSNSTPGVDMSTGSLGQGLSFGLGVALAARMDGKPFAAFVMLGDGEHGEGQVWEAALNAAHLKLGNLVAIVDHNKIQNDGFIWDILEVRPLVDKWRAFGWHVIEIDGHDMAEIVGAYSEASGVTDKPTVIVAHTIKGKGVSFMENNPDFHGKAPTPEQLEQALKELA